MKKITLLITVGLILSSLPAYGQQDQGTTAKEINVKAKQERLDLLSNIKEKRTELQNKIKQERSGLQTAAKEQVEKLKKAAVQEKDAILKGLQEKRQNLQDRAKDLRQNLKDNAKDLRDSFKEKVTSSKERARIAVAHGKGLKMINRYRSAISRFNHILSRLEKRTEKIKAQGIDVSSVTPLIEEAKNMQVENAARLEELKAKYESLLEGENLQGIGGQAKEIAKELKAEIEKLHNKLKEIALAIKALNPQQ